MIRAKHYCVAIILVVSIIVLQAFTPGPPADEKPKNLKVLPKNISHEELIKIMRGYSKSLGVHCDFCHKKIEEGNPPKLDFASDEKDEKRIARKMMKMTNAINKKYIAKIENGSLDRITCVTCHMGNPHPTINVDSLKVT